MTNECPRQQNKDKVNSRKNLHECYTHHYCSHFGVDAINYPVIGEDFDENFDGELYSTGFMKIGIHEFLTPYCPHCGVKLSLNDSDKDSYQLANFTLAIIEEPKLF